MGMDRIDETNGLKIFYNTKFLERRNSSNQISLISTPKTNLATHHVHMINHNLRKKEKQAKYIQHQIYRTFNGKQHY